MNGLLIADKPGGMTSHDVVNRVRRLTGEQSIGHLGTLDPMATGVLPLLLGKWTRLSQFFGKMDKSYTGTIRFGYATDTYDADGRQVGERVKVLLDHYALEKGIQAFKGDIVQMPPIFSAKKVAGKSAHALARAGKPVELRAVPVTVHHFAITSVSGECAEFEAKVSAGGYIRSLAHELGQTLGCGAHLSSLRRTAAGPFVIEQALTVEQFQEAASGGMLAQHLPHPRTLLPDIPSTTTDAYTAGRIRNGTAVNLPEYSNSEMVKIFEGRNQLVGIGKRIAGTLFQPIVVLG